MAKRKWGLAHIVAGGLVLALVLGLVEGEQDSGSYNDNSEYKKIDTTAANGDSGYIVIASGEALMNKPLVLFYKNLGSMKQVSEHCIKDPGAHPSARIVFSKPLIGSTLFMKMEALGRTQIELAFNCTGDVCTPQSMNTGGQIVNLANANQQQLDLVSLGMLGICDITEQTVQKAPDI